MDQRSEAILDSVSAAILAFGEQMKAQIDAMMSELSSIYLTVCKFTRQPPRNLPVFETAQEIERMLQSLPVVTPVSSTWLPDGNLELHLSRVATAHIVPPLLANEETTPPPSNSTVS
jgi:hypothetical protein